MAAVENIKYFFSQVMGRLYVPRKLQNSTNQKILHLSDTPTSLYTAIGDLVVALKPDVIIHTGDLADDIKLEHNAHNIKTYQRVIGPFIKMMEECSVKQVYIIPGNHDDVHVISQHINKSQLLKEGEIIEINNCKLGLAHKIRRLPKGTEFNLYGHNFKKPLNNNDNEVYLNGLQNINVILLPSNEVVKIPYPWGTNRDRKMDNRYMLPNTV